MCSGMCCHPCPPRLPPLCPSGPVGPRSPRQHHQCQPLQRTEAISIHCGRAQLIRFAHPKTIRPLPRTYVLAHSHRTPAPIHTSSRAAQPHIPWGPPYLQYRYQSRWVCWPHYPQVPGQGHGLTPCWHLPGPCPHSPQRGYAQCSGQQRAQSPGVQESKVSF
jgi:hypothetical protein